MSESLNNMLGQHGTERQNASAPSPATEPSHQDTSAATTMTIRVPKLNTQSVMLGLIALITVFQTVQLYTLQAKAASLPAIKASTAAPAAASGAPAAGGSGLESMVGGC